MAATTYRWQGNLYCGTDAVLTLTSIEPWKEWLDAGNRPSDNPEADLESIAEFFGIDRTDAEQVDRRRFPIRSTRASGLCSGCLFWFE